MVIKDIDIKKVSVFQMLDAMNSQGVLKKYFDENPKVEIEYFSEKEQNEILSTNEYKNLKKAINSEFVGK